MGVCCEERLSCPILCWADAVSRSRLQVDARLVIVCPSLPLHVFGAACGGRGIFEATGIDALRQMVLSCLFVTAAQPCIPIGVDSTVVGATLALGRCPVKLVHAR